MTVCDFSPAIIIVFMNICLASVSWNFVLIKYIGYWSNCGWTLFFFKYEKQYTLQPEEIKPQKAFHKSGSFLRTSNGDSIWSGVCNRHVNGYSVLKRSGYPHIQYYMLSGRFGLQLNPFLNELLVTIHILLEP